MTNIFTLEKNEDFSLKMNIDELYEKKRQYDLNQLALFNKILNRVHVKIKNISKQTMNEQYCWYVVPEMIIGVPKYDQGACIAYILDQLKENGFNVKYIHPNTIFISWTHWVPSYVRTELKKKTGIEVNEYGEKIENIEIIPNDSLKPINATTAGKDNTKKSIFTPITTYKPTGTLVYDDNLLMKLNNKIN